MPLYGFLFPYILYNGTEKENVFINKQINLVTIAFFFNKQVVYRFSVFRIMPGIGEGK